MHIDTYYKQFWRDAMHHYGNGNFECDDLIDNPGDNRFGITVLLRPSAEVRAAIAEMLQQLKRIEPDQYYYPETDMHVTILSVVSCYAGFNKHSFDAAAYMQVVRQSLQGIIPFKVHFQGITASPSCIMVQGYPDGMLNNFRNKLRENYKASGLEISFDIRYTIVVAHATVMRFRQKPQAPQRFIRRLQDFRNHEFGTTLCSEVELVYNDWYQRRQKGLLLANFKLLEQP